MMMMMMILGQEAEWPCCLTSFPDSYYKLLLIVFLGRLSAREVFCMECLSIVFYCLKKTKFPTSFSLYFFFFFFLSYKKIVPLFLVSLLTNIDSTRQRLISYQSEFTIINLYYLLVLRPIF